jgi:hypothetical protein
MKRGGGNCTTDTVMPAGQVDVTGISRVPADARRKTHGYRPWVRPSSLERNTVMGDEHSMSDKLHHLGEHAKDALKDAAERLGEVPTKVGERALAAGAAGEHLVDRLAAKAHLHEDDAEHSSDRQG